ncbi:hypothetical protein ACEQ8H_008652 [Pleosporales sp. CAS-2024a]
MRTTILTFALCVLGVPIFVTAGCDVVSPSVRSIGSAAKTSHPISLRRRSQRAELQLLGVTGAKEKQAIATAKEKKEAATGVKEKQDKAKKGVTGVEAEAGEDESKENEVEIESAFDAAVAVQGGELKQDLVFTPSTVGKFEFEFQSAAADEVTVTENAGAAAAAPPTGFEALEPNSYKVALSVSKGAGLTLSKIDYIFDTTAAGLAGKDIRQAQVGKRCAESGAFVVSSLLGQLEFELEENEVSLNLNKNITAQGEWGIFLPAATSAVAGAAEGAAGAATDKGNAALEAAQKKKATEEVLQAEKTIREMSQQQRTALAKLLAASQRIH